jgi:hypothetical protein
LFLERLLQTLRLEECAALVAWVAILVVEQQRRRRQMPVVVVGDSHFGLVVQSLAILVR